MSADENAAVQVVPVSHAAEVHHDDGYWETEWVASNLGLAITTEELWPQRFEIRGLAHVWSLRTGKVTRTIEVPARIQTIVGDRESPYVIIAGGPSGKYNGTPFVWRVNVISGEITDRFLDWSDTSTGSRRHATIVNGALSRDRTRFLLKLRDGCVAYDLSEPSKPAIALRQADWETQAESPTVSPSGLPNWFLKIGASDKQLTLNQTSAGVGLWRNDTWELVLRLRSRQSPIFLWIPAPDGSVVLGIRAFREAHLIWDLKNLTAVEWSEPNLLLWCEPAFTDDGSVLRFARESSGRTVEFVSRNWRTGQDRVEHSTNVPPGAYFRGARANEGLTAVFHYSEHDLSAEFSDNASAVAITSELGSTIVEFASSTNDTTVSHIALRAGDVAGITADRKFIYYWPPIDDERLAYTAGWEWHVDNARAQKIVDIGAINHPPALVFAEHPAIEGQVLACRVSGASLGPYAFNLWTRTGRGGQWRQWANQHLQYLAGAALLRSAHGHKFLVAWFDHAACSFDLQTGERLATFERHDLWPWRGMQRRPAAPLVGRVFLSLNNGGAQILEVTDEGSFREVMQLWSPAAGSWLAVLPDGRYFAAPVANVPVFFKRGDEVFPVEDYDLDWNRPADVASEFEAPDEVIEMLKRRREQRIQRLGTTHFASRAGGGPSLILEHPPSCIHDGPKLSVPIQLATGDHPLSAIDLYVNDVPVYGTAGYQIDVKPRARRNVELVTPLTTGANKIQIRARDTSSAVSARTLLNVHRSRIGSRPTRFIVSIGVSDYGHPDLNLQYAAKDARDIADAMAAAVEHRGYTRTVVLTDAGASRTQILETKKLLYESRTEDEVVVFVAGHGGIDNQGQYFFCPHDFEPVKLKQALNFADLESLFDGIPALNRLLLVDTCHSGELTEEEAASVVATHADSLALKAVRIRRINALSKARQRTNAYGVTNAASDLFLDLRRTTGATIISASGALEFAYEDPKRQNGLFTHSILRVIEDATAHRKSELKASTLAESVGSMVEAMTDGLQNPRARFINLTTDFSVVVSDDVGPPADAEGVVLQYFRWLDRANQPLHPRVMTCFATEVLYYGRLMNSDEVRREEEGYAKRFRIRNDKITSMTVSPQDASGIVRVEIEIEFEHTTDMPVSEADAILRRIGAGEETGWRDAGGSRHDEHGNVTHRMLKLVGTKKLAAFVQPSGCEWKIARIEVVEG